MLEFFERDSGLVPTVWMLIAGRSNASASKLPVASSLLWSAMRDVAGCISTTSLFQQSQICGEYRLSKQLMCHYRMTLVWKMKSDEIVKRKCCRDFV